MLCPDFDISIRSLSIFGSQARQHFSQLVPLRFRQISSFTLREDCHQKNRQVWAAIIGDNPRAAPLALALRAPAQLTGAARSRHQLTHARIAARLSISSVLSVSARTRLAATNSGVS